MGFGLLFLARRALAVFGAVLALFLAPQALTQPARAAGLITVTGTGEARGVPDEAVISAGVVNQARTAAAALSENSRAMNAVFAALKRLGVPEKDVQTSNFSIEPQYPPFNANTPDRPITGYQVSNTVSVILDDVSKAGPTLDALVAAGANQAGGISFAIRNSEALLEQARTDAVKDAAERAETYAKAAGVTLGPIASIGEGGVEQPRPVFMAMAKRAAPTPIAAGEQSVTASVTIAWQIK